VPLVVTGNGGNLWLMKRATYYFGHLHTLANFFVSLFRKLIVIVTFLSFCHFLKIYRTFLTVTLVRQILCNTIYLTFFENFCLWLHTLVFVIILKYYTFLNHNTLKMVKFVQISLGCNMLTKSCLRAFNLNN